MSSKTPPSVPVSRNVIEAIRYSYDFLDAAAEFAYNVVKNGLQPDSRPDNWLTRYMDRNWREFSLADKLGILSFSQSGEGFWRSDDQHRLFENLQTVRNALTHPGIFGVETIEQFADHFSPPLTSAKKHRGKMRSPKNVLSVFARHPAELGREDAKKAVEIALRHAARFDELFCSRGLCNFSRIDPQTRVIQSPSKMLSRMRLRYFDSIWLTEPKT
jgi:hypothetical protein